MRGPEFERPSREIVETTLQRGNGLVQCIDIDKCFPYFVETFGCSVCIKVCPFNRVGYDRVKRAWEDDQK